MERAAVVLGWMDAFGGLSLIVAHRMGWIAWSWTTTLAPFWVPFVAWCACCALALLWAWAEFYLVRLWNRWGNE